MLFFFVSLLFPKSFFKINVATSRTTSICRGKLKKKKSLQKDYQALKESLFQRSSKLIAAKIWITSPEMGVSQGFIWGVISWLFTYRTYFCFTRRWNLVRCKLSPFVSMPGELKFTEPLQCANTSKYVTCIISNSLHSKMIRYLLRFSIFYQWENWSPKRLIDLPKVLQIESRQKLTLL